MGRSFLEIYDSQSISLSESFGRKGESGTDVEISSSFKAGGKRSGLEGQDIAQYVKQQQALDREERAAWCRDVQKSQAEQRQKRKGEKVISR